MYIEKKCVGCGKCATACPNGAIETDKDGYPIFYREKCTICGDCVSVCLQDALEIVGEEKTVAEIMDIVMRDKAYYDKSGGGLTISGGEPFLQPDGLKALLKAAKKEGLHTAIETCGSVDTNIFMSVADLVDLYLMDIKHTQSDILYKHTGGSAIQILNNLKTIAFDNPKKVVIRVPVIPEFNHNMAAIKDIFNVAKENNIKQVHLLPFHTLGLDKYSGLGKKYEMKGIPMLKKEDLGMYKKEGATMGLDIRIGG